MSDLGQRPAILIVDDEPLIIDLLRGALEEAGFDSVQASDADQVFALLDADGPNFVGLVTDINLGSAMDGWDVARRAREKKAAVAVVYCSGGSPHDWSIKGVPQSVVLTKPFAVAQVVVALSNLINGSSPAA
ncbi:MAG TPA: response regulator [Caulobacteraceae bacterium]